jgi:glycosyltransferase involved in cell wall biosynthesis
MFSVVIPLFNKSTYIEKCLQSVLNQTCQDFEVIVVNDGSTDDSVEKVEKFNVQSSKFKVISQSNTGVSAARNNGVNAAKFDYIAFLDPDDWWEPTFLEEMKSLIESFPEAGIYGSGYSLVKNKRKRIAPIGIDRTFDKGIINYCRVYSKTLCMPLTSISVVIPKTIFESENGFKPALKLGEDFDLWIRVSLKYPVAFLNKPLADYNQDADLSGRAVGNLHNPENHVLWNLEYLANEELSDPDLKQLLDNLRVYGLLPYFLTREYRSLAKQELDKVDWKNQPVTARMRYTKPRFLLKIESRFYYAGSRIKQSLLRNLRQNIKSYCI